MFAHRAPAHPHDESPAGYSSAGCSPALPASASPAGAIMQGVISPGKDFAANGKLSLIPLSQLRGAVPCLSPVVSDGGDIGQRRGHGKWGEQ